MKHSANKIQTGFNRRRYPRLKPDQIPGLKNVELSQGSDIDIVNISRGGMLLETETRLRPDSRIVLRVTTNEGPMRIEGVILRSAICSLKGTPKYRSAVEFKQPLELLDEAVTVEPEIAREEDASRQKDNIVDNEKEPSAILTVIASDEEGVRLQESFSLNNW